jgi:hypothetical protein
MSHLAEYTCCSSVAFEDTFTFTSLNVQSNSEGLDLVVEAIAKAGYTGKVVIGMDVAASEFYTEDKVRSDAPCGVMGCGCAPPNPTPHSLWTRGLRATKHAPRY